MEDINNFIPSLLNPRTLPKANGNITLTQAVTQNSIVSRTSLSLKRNNCLTVKKRVPSFTNTPAVDKEINKENLINQKLHVTATKNIVAKDKINTYGVILNNKNDEGTLRTNGKDVTQNNNNIERGPRRNSKEVTQNSNNNNEETLRTNDKEVTQNSNNNEETLRTNGKEVTQNSYNNEETLRTNGKEVTQNSNNNEETLRTNGKEVTLKNNNNNERGPRRNSKGVTQNSNNNEETLRTNGKGVTQNSNNNEETLRTNGKEVTQNNNNNERGPRKNSKRVTQNSNNNEETLRTNGKEVTLKNNNNNKRGPRRNSKGVTQNSNNYEDTLRTNSKEVTQNSIKKEGILRSNSNEVTPNNNNKNESKGTSTNKNERLWLQKAIDDCSIELSAFNYLNKDDDKNNSSSFNPNFEPEQELSLKQINEHILERDNCSASLISISSATDLIQKDIEECDSDRTESYDFNTKLPISLSFGLTYCENIDISTKNSNIKKISITRKDNSTVVDCEVVESSGGSLYIAESNAESDEEMEGNAKDNLPSSPKSLAIAVNLEIKKKSREDLNTSSLDNTENSKVLILNTNTIDRISHVIVQPPNYNLVKRQNSDGIKYTTSAKKRKIYIGQNVQWKTRLKQPLIDSFLVKNSNVKLPVVNGSCSESVGSDDVVMNRNLISSAKCDHHKAGGKVRKESETPSPRSPRPRRESPKPPQQSHLRVKSANADPHRVQSADSTRRNADSLQFTLPNKTRSNRTTLQPKPIPAFKMIAGTYFAVDAFSYGDIPNVKHYFLTHFHSDHYAGLKKTFNKVLFCSKITAELCVSRLGVNPKCIRILNCDETSTIDNIDVTVVDANHCPGAFMLIFSLPSGKTLLHTGDFRASPLMESYPIFWNTDIHTIYLDTTYCNPRYDFPTQDQSLEMALYLLRQKKLALEKVGKKFSSVLIVCGTYTIGKEKFFLGMSRRVGCSVWACPEKDRVLQAVEGRSFSHAPPQSCQLHVVPMRDLTHEKLSSYLQSLQGAFAEVVAFKPSGWENGKNTSLEKDAVTIHGIPYSEHSSFSEMIRFVKFLKPKQVIPTVDISGGPKAVQKYFPCPVVVKEVNDNQSKLTDFFTMRSQPSTAVT